MLYFKKWYKLSVGFGVLRRWYLEKGVSPIAILRIRPDHLITTKWNLTMAHLEFRSRTAARCVFDHIYFTLLLLLYYILFYFFGMVPSPYF